MSADTPYIIDTAVLVAGVLTNEVNAPTAVIVDAMLAARFVFLLSHDLLAEYRAVLVRPKISARHRMSDAQVDIFLQSIVENGAVRAPKRSKVAPPDPDDALLWALLMDDVRAVLVTGDKALLEAPPRLGSVISPRDMVNAEVEALTRRR